MPQYIVGCTSTIRTVWSFLRKLKIDLPYARAIPLGDLCKENEMVTFTLILVQPTTVKRRYELKRYPSTGEYFSYLIVGSLIQIYILRGSFSLPPLLSPCVPFLIISSLSYYNDLVIHFTFIGLTF